MARINFRREKRVGFVSYQSRIIFADESKERNVSCLTSSTSVTRVVVVSRSKAKIERAESGGQVVRLTVTFQGCG